jgi:hypothetical protein
VIASAAATPPRTSIMPHRYQKAVPNQLVGVMTDNTSRRFAGAAPTGAGRTRTAASQPPAARPRQSSHAMSHQPPVDLLSHVGEKALDGIFRPAFHARIVSQNAGRKSRGHGGGAWLLRVPGRYPRGERPLRLIVASFDRFRSRTQNPSLCLDRPPSERIWRSSVPRLVRDARLRSWQPQLGRL